MAASLTPRVRLMVVCDHVRESKTEANVYNLKGVRQGIVGNVFPCAPSQLWLFLLLSSPRPGRYPGCVRVVDDRTDKAIFYGHLVPIPVFEADKDGPEFALIRLRCAFPDAGRYSVQVCFSQEHGSDAVKGELPFSVFKEVRDP